MNWWIWRSTYKNISVFKIIPPVWSDFPLSANVPDIQFKTLWLYTFDVKTLKQKHQVFSKQRGYMSTYDWFMLRFDRKQQNSVSNYPSIKKRKTHQVLLDFEITFLTKVHLPAMLFVNSEILCGIRNRWYWKVCSDREEKCIYTCSHHLGRSWCSWHHAECTPTCHYWEWELLR